jgi:hypothetical protein
MSWRRKPRTLKEELLAEGPREAEREDAATFEERRATRARVVHLAVWFGVFILLLALKFGVEFLPAWVGLIVGVLVVAHFVSIFVRSTRRSSADAGKGFRTLSLLWLAICVAATVLIAIGGFQPDDRALLGVMWPILGLIWVAYRLRSARATRRA